MKRVLVWVGVVLSLLVVVGVAGWYSAFGRNSARTDGPVADGVDLVKDAFVNVFVLDAGQGKVALVDCGKDKEGAAILAALARKGLSPASVAAIFLTHGHGDHTAGCHLFSGADVYAMDSEVALVGDAARVTHPLKDGDVATVGDLRVEAFSVPGHTPGSAVYLARGVLFFGDSAGASKSGEVMKAVSLFSKDPALNVASLKGLSARLAPRRAEINAMAFGHTGSLSSIEPLAAFAAR
jgi:glyoxylase-like metal-dependent hydrolase (beta-lactamase superfamily II)